LLVIEVLLNRDVGALFGAAVGRAPACFDPEHGLCSRI